MHWHCLNSGVLLDATLQFIVNALNHQWLCVNDDFNGCSIIPNDHDTTISKAHNAASNLMKKEKAETKNNFYYPIPQAASPNTKQLELGLTASDKQPTYKPTQM